MKWAYFIFLEFPEKLKPFYNSIGGPGFSPLPSPGMWLAQAFLAASVPGQGTLPL